MIDLASEALTVAVQVDARTPPAISTEIMRHTILNTRLILPTPPSLITIKSIAADAI
jgi:hypothetical protein